MAGDDYDYLVEMYGERMAKRWKQARSYGATVRECCETDTAMWHGRPCTVNGPTGPGQLVAIDTPVQWSPEEETKVYGPQTKVVVTDNLPPGPIVVGEFTHDGTETAGLDYGMNDALVVLNPREAEEAKRLGFNNFVESPDVQTVTVKGWRLTPYRVCCATLVGTAHLRGCGTNFFADGQTVIKPSVYGLAFPWERAPLRIREDTAASDRTFENETRPL